MYSKYRVVVPVLLSGSLFAIHPDTGQHQYDMMVLKIEVSLTLTLTLPLTLTLKPNPKA